MLTAEKVYEWMRMQKYPVWKLYRMQGFQNTMIGDYKGTGNLPDSDSKGSNKNAEKEIEFSINALSAMLSIFENDSTAKFILKCYPSHTANDQSMRTPGEFSLNGKPSDESMNGLNGLPRDLGAMGYVPASQMEAQLALVREQSKLDFEKILLQKDREDFKNEIREKEEKYNSNVGRIETALVKVADKYFFNDEPIPLAGTDKQKIDPKEKEVEDLAQFLFDELDNPEDIRVMARVIKNMVNRKKNPQHETEPEPQEAE